MEAVLGSYEDDLRHSATERHSLVLLRWTLFLASAALILSDRLFEPLPPSSIGLLAVFGASNVLLYAIWDRFSVRPGMDILLAVVDTLFICLAIFQAGVAPTELILLFLLVLVLVALSSNLRHTVVAGVAVGAVYVIALNVIRPEGVLHSPAFMIRIPFLYSLALYFGFFSARAGDKRKRTLEIDQERKELQALMEVIDTINSSLDLHHVMLAITKRMAEAVSLSRCSALLVESGEGRGVVIASNDVPDVSSREIDLAKYPEVRQAIDTRSPVLIEDVMTHPLMQDVKHHITGAGFNSILVLPMIHRDDLVGTLMLRAATGEAQFNPRVVSFCQTIANASANALKNAMLYRQMREEASRHRSTVEKLKSILENSMDLIVTTDLEGKITDFNRTAEEALGYRREEVLGRPLTEIYRGAGDRNQFLSALRSKGHIDERGATMTSRDGTRHTFDLTVAVVRDELGEVVGSVCVGKKQFAFH